MSSRNTERFNSILEKSNNKLWGRHLCVPKRIADKFGDGRTRRVVCTLNGTAEHQCALLPTGDGNFLITVNKKLRDSLGLQPGMTVNVTLAKDQSTYGLPIPEELAELLKQDRTGDALFHALTPGRQRTLLHIVGTPKSSNLRLTRAIAIVRHLKENYGKINYRQLNLQIRGTGNTERSAKRTS